MRYLSLLLVAFVFSSCASAPINLSPAGVEAFNKTRLIKSLDVFRDIAIDGNKTTPSLISTATTRKVVTYHRSALLVINASGVKAITTVSLDEVIKDLPKSEADLLAPYIALAKVVINEVTK